MRLLPAAYVLVGAVSLAASFHLLVLARGDISFAVAYVMNFDDNRGWPLGHLWSLAIEEQFYLLWPITLASLGRARASRFLIGLLFAAPLLRLSSPFVGPAFNFVVWTDALGAGCLLALLRQELAANPIPVGPPVAMVLSCADRGRAGERHPVY